MATSKRLVVLTKKIEGFFDACNHFGLTGQQGCVIPKSNATDLMLRADVAQACREGRFHIYAVTTIHEAIEIMTGVPAGSVEGDYADGTVLAAAVVRAREFWQKTLSSPERMTQSIESDEASDELVRRIESDVENA